jgi:hypothetical protein
VKDLIERLRECAADSDPLWSDKENQEEAADAIERLAQERDEARSEVTRLRTIMRKEGLL